MMDIIDDHALYIVVMQLISYCLSQSLLTAIPQTRQVPGINGELVQSAKIPILYMLRIVASEAYELESCNTLLYLANNC